MVQDETKKIIKEQFAKLPKNVQDTILSAELDKTLLALTQEHNLNVNQGRVIENETMLVMLGLENPGDFVGSIESEGDIPHKQALLIATKINDAVFMKIREAMRQVQDQGKMQVGREPESAEEKPQQTHSFRTPTPTSVQPQKPHQAEVEQEKKEEKSSNQPLKGSVPQNLPTGDLVALKLGGEMHLPKQEKEISVKEKSPESGEEEKSPLKKEYSTDPYREPIEESDKQLRQS